jgi:hypothetical protein
LHHGRAAFTNGVALLNRCLQSLVGQDARKNIAAATILALLGGTLGGNYTFSETALKRIISQYLTARVLKAMVIVHWPSRSAALSTMPASFAVIVDAKDTAARRF